MIGDDLYDTAYKWLGRLPGGLGVASAVFGAFFGFICGSAMAGVATIGFIAFPQMEKRGYSRSMAMGALLVSGGLAALIPPSIYMMLYCFVEEQSLGDLMMAGILPGLLLTLMISIFIIGMCTLNPKLGPPAEDRFSMREKLKSLVKLVPVLITFGLVIVGIYMGVWSPVEAGASACVIIVLIALAYRRLTWGSVKRAATIAGTTSIMVYAITIAAGMFALLLFVSGLTDGLKGLLTGLPVPPWVVIVIIMFIMMIEGMFIVGVPMILISTAVFTPTVFALGYDPIWWGIVLIVACEMAFVTPPMSLGLFVIKHIAPTGTTFGQLIRAALTFVPLLWVFVAILIAFPDIVLFLPNVLREPLTYIR